VHVGGQPQDAVLAAGSLWVADFEGRVVRVDPERRRVAGARAVDGQPGAIAAGAGSLWVIASETAAPRVATELVRIEPRSGRILDRAQIGATTREATSGNGLVVVDGAAVWVVPNVYTARPVLERRDPEGTVTARLPAGRIGAEQLQALAAGGNRVWALGEAGTIAVIDSATAEVVQRLKNVASDLSVGSLPLPRQRIAPDATGAWVSNGETVLRIEGGRVVRRIPLGTEIGPVAVADDVLWAVATDDASRRSWLIRIDPESGEVTGTVALGTRLPAALVPDGRDVWVVTTDGTALLGGS
jgi:hypothetical protein